MSTKIFARVHLYPPDHCAGAERMLHELLKALVQRGHQVNVSLSRDARKTKPYELDGVTIYPRGSHDWQGMAKGSDIFVTHLDNTSTMIKAGLVLKRPLIQVLHNTHAPTRMWANCYNSMLVYNSRWMADTLGNDPNGIIVHPPVFVEDYKVERPLDGHSVTLINLNQAKGGVLFAQLAAMLPAVNFLGVKGAYGEQLEPKLPNVTILEHGADMREVYARTRVLLVPSHYESWGRVAIEAACSGIPVIASATPGLQEALADAGRYLPLTADARHWKVQLQEMLGFSTRYEGYRGAVRHRAYELDEISRKQVAEFCDRVEAL